MKTLILGLGNSILGDDGVDNRVAQEFEGNLACRQMAGLRLNDTRHASSPHDVDLATALELVKELGFAVPQEIVICVIEVANTCNFSTKCTPEADKSLLKCVKMIVKELNGSGQAEPIKGSRHFSDN